MNTNYDPDSPVIPNRRTNKLVALENTSEDNIPGGAQQQQQQQQQQQGRLYNTPPQLKDLAYNANVDEEDKIDRRGSSDLTDDNVTITYKDLNATQTKKLLTAYAIDPSSPATLNNDIKGGDEKDTSDSNSLILKYDGSNIDTTGERARLLGVRKLEESEGPSVHPLEGNSDSSSTLPEASDDMDIFLPKRYVLAIMMFMGMVNMYAIRVNLNVAIGAMVNNHTVVQGGVAILVVSETSDVCYSTSVFFTER